MVGKGEIPVRRFNIKKKKPEHMQYKVPDLGNLGLLWGCWKGPDCRGLSMLHEAPGQFLFVFK